jgi:hypothetical protein
MSNLTPTSQKNQQKFPARTDAPAADLQQENSTTNQPLDADEQDKQDGDKEGFYKLQTPFTARRDNANFEFTDLVIPEIITVGMMRRVKSATQILFAYDLTEVCAGLNPFDMLKLHSADAAGYAESVSDLLQPRETHNFEIPEIKPFKALLAKITVDAAQPVEFAAQVLQHSGMSAATINAMDFRDFAPAIQIILGAFISPKI